MDLGLLDIPNSLHLLVSPQNEFINSVDLEEVRWRAALKIKSSLRECHLRIAQFDVVKEIKNWHLVVFFIFYILFFDSGIARTLVLPVLLYCPVQYWDSFPSSEIESSEIEM